MVEVLTSSTLETICKIELYRRSIHRLKSENMSSQHPPIKVSTAQTEEEKVN